MLVKSAHVLASVPTFTESCRHSEFAKQAESYCVRQEIGRNSKADNLCKTTMCCSYTPVFIQIKLTTHNLLISEL